ncbi:MAG TPA: SUMF1/EgtB/PvdO family nonheme iron enzyme [Planctomycetaceae bacterium]|nr:SUMF1/EgtB/PvdO family nonheme iron enzyme [Planctomycetaceae bacterium]
MTPTLDEFRTRLVNSKLLDAEELERFLGGLEEVPDDLKELARILIKAGKLTKYQAMQLAQDRGAELVLGNYVILDKIGSGGMGDVFLAEHRKMSRRVALKILPGGPDRADSSIHRFQREVRAAARLTHPNIVTAYDADEFDGKYFFAMEYVAGSDLSSRVKRQGTLQVAQAVDIIRQAAKGLGYAHEQGVIHRDIKPGNLLWDQHGNVKILDMGLARFAENPLDVEEVSALTQSGTIMGTVDYMSPEQALDTRTAGPQSDVYSIGCTLFYLLIGRPMFIEETVMKRLMAKQSQTPPPLSKFRDDIPPRLETIYQKMVACDVESRYQSMSEVVAALESLSGLEETQIEFPAQLPKQAAEYAVGSSDVTRAVKAEETETDPHTMQVSIQARTDSRMTRAKTRSTSRYFPLIAGLIGISCLGLIGFLALRGGGDGENKPETPANVELAGDESEQNGADANSGFAEESTLPDIFNRSPLNASEQAGETDLTSTKTPSSFTIDGSQGAWNLKNEDVEPLVAEVPEEILAAARANESNPITTIPDTGKPSPHAFRIEPTNKRPPRLLQTPFPPQQAQKAQKDWARHLGLDVTYENSLGMKFQLIPPGEFEMGFSKERLDYLRFHYETHLSSRLSPETEDSSPPQAVRLTVPYYLGATEVSQGQFQEIMGENPSHYQPGGFSEGKLLGRDHLVLPVEGVTWIKAVEFCNKLSLREQLSPCYRQVGDDYESIEGDGYRLPTSAEWEYACMSGTSGYFWFGDPPNLKNTPPARQPKLYGELMQGHDHFTGPGSGLAAANGRPNPIGSSVPNHFGLTEVHGGVREWCNDWYEVYQAHDETIVDPKGPKSGTAKVIRGGGFYEHNALTAHLTGPWRGGADPNRLGAGVSPYWPGLRIVRVIPAVPTTAPKNAVADSVSQWIITPKPAKGREPRLPKVPFTPQEAQNHQKLWARHFGLDVTYENSLGMKFQLIPPGEFEMGLTELQRNYLVEYGGLPKEDYLQPYPPQPVRHTHPYYLAATEVTQQQFLEVMGENPSTIQPGGGEERVLLGRDHLPLPVTSVLWNDAAEFCNRLSLKEGLKPCYRRIEKEEDVDYAFVPAGDGYRLPTEEEWEYACRAGSSGLFWFNDPPLNAPPSGWRTAYEKYLTQFEWIGVNSHNSTQNVGQKPSNPFGLHDLLGNAKEWCHSDYLPFNGEPMLRVDPIGALSSPNRVLRGGSAWSHTLDPLGGLHPGFHQLVSAYRTSKDKNEIDFQQRGSNSGFRVLRAIPKPAPENRSTAQPQVPAARKWAIVPEKSRGREPKLAKVPFTPQEAQNHQKLWARHFGLDVTYENSLGMKFQLIPPGEFEMGFAEDRMQFLKSVYDQDYITLAEHSTPQQSVRLTRPYYLASAEVTQKQFLELMETNPSGMQPGGKMEAMLLGRDHLIFPADSTTWYQAVEFCNRLSQREDLTPCYRIEEKRVELVPDADGYRLPTSAEWEYAALAGHEGFYWFGDPPNLTAAPAGRWNELYITWRRDFEWFEQQPTGSHPIATSKSNPFGLYDMHGNVEEWCWDWFQFYSDNPKMLIDPTGPETGTAKVCRGVSSFFGVHPLPGTVGPFRRGLALEYYHSFSPGVRVVRVIPAVPDDNK